MFKALDLNDQVFFARSCHRRESGLSALQGVDEKSAGKEITILCLVDNKFKKLLYSVEPRQVHATLRNAEQGD